MAVSVSSVILGSYDRIAKLRQASQAAITGGTDFWTRTDSTDPEDVTFENRLNGSVTDAVDTAVAKGMAGSTFAPFLTLLSTYASTDLALTGANARSAYLTSIASRIPYEAAEVITEAFGATQTMPASQVFPQGTLVGTAATQASSGMHSWGSILGTAGASTVTPGTALSTKCLGAVVLIVNNTATTSCTDLVLTCTLQDATTKDLTVTLSADTQWAKTYLGAQGISDATLAAGSETITMAATSQFKVGEQVLIKESIAQQEVGIIESIVTNTSITLTLPTVNAYTNAGFVLPMFTNVAWKSGTVANTKEISIWAMPDRAIAL